jgi:Mlc titration factor MtfA (ptsG expression regulator)
MERVVAQIESKIPLHLLSEVEMIIVGWFDEFEERSINAFYEGGTLFISSMQDSEADIYDDIIHEIAHSLENAHGRHLYADQKLQDEFLRKRKYIHDLLWAKGFKAPVTFFLNVEYDQEFDDFLYKTVGYDRLATLLSGIFVSPYAATSLREYFATGFTEFYLDSNHNFIKKISPALYRKIISLQDPKILDNEH